MSIERDTEALVNDNKELVLLCEEMLEGLNDPLDEVDTWLRIATISREAHDIRLRLNIRDCFHVRVSGENKKGEVMHILCVFEPVYGRPGDCCEYLNMSKDFRKGLRQKALIHGGILFTRVYGSDWKPRDDPSVIEVGLSAKRYLGQYLRLLKRMVEELPNMGRLEARGFEHSEDYHTVRQADGRTHSLSTKEAAVVQRLHEALVNGTPELSWETVRDRAGIGASRSLSAFLNGNKELRNLIVKGKRKGTVRLAP